MSSTESSDGVSTPSLEISDSVPSAFSAPLAHSVPSVPAEPSPPTKCKKRKRAHQVEKDVEGRSDDHNDRPRLNPIAPEKAKKRKRPCADAIEGNTDRPHDHEKRLRLEQDVVDTANPPQDLFELPLDFQNNDLDGMVAAAPVQHGDTDDFSAFLQDTDFVARIAEFNGEPEYLQVHAPIPGSVTVNTPTEGAFLCDVQSSKLVASPEDEQYETVAGNESAVSNFTDGSRNPAFLAALDPSHDGVLDFDAWLAAEFLNDVPISDVHLASENDVVTASGRTPAGPPTLEEFIVSPEFADVDFSQIEWDEENGTLVSHALPHVQKAGVEVSESAPRMTGSLGEFPQNPVPDDSDVLTKSTLSPLYISDLTEGLLVGTSPTNSCQQASDSGSLNSSSSNEQFPMRFNDFGMPGHGYEFHNTPLNSPALVMGGFQYDSQMQAMHLHSPLQSGQYMSKSMPLRSSSPCVEDPIGIQCPTAVPTQPVIASMQQDGHPLQPVPHWPVSPATPIATTARAHAAELKTTREYNELFRDLPALDYIMPTGPFPVNFTVVEINVLLPKWYQESMMSWRFCNNGLHPPAHKAMVQAHWKIPIPELDSKGKLKESWPLRNTICCGYISGIKGNGWKEEAKDWLAWRKRKDDAKKLGQNFSELEPQNDPIWEWERKKHEKQYKPRGWDKTNISVDQFQPDRIRTGKDTMTQPSIAFKELKHAKILKLPEGDDAGDLTRALNFALTHQRYLRNGRVGNYLFPDHIHEILDIVGRTPITEEHQDPACIKRYDELAKARQGKPGPCRRTQSK